MSPRLDVSMSPGEITELLDRSMVAVLTTLGSDGWPHAAGMWYVRSGDMLQMWTYAKSQKARNLARDPRCAAVVESGEQYEELKGVLIRSRAVLTQDHGEVANIGRALYERYTARRTGIAFDEIEPRPEGTALTAPGGAEAGPSQEIRRQAHKRVGILLPLGAPASWDHSKHT